MIPAPHHQAKDGKKLELAQVIAPYEATSKEQLSLVQVSNKTKVPCDPLITVALSEGYNDRHQEEDRNWMVAGRTGKGGEGNLSNVMVMSLKIMVNCQVLLES